MSSLARRLACSAAMTALLIGSQPAFAQAGPEASILAPANIAGGLLRAGVSYARMVADIRYGALEVDAKRGSIVLRDLQIRGIGDQARCQITLGQAQFSGITFWGAEDMRGRLDATDLKIANNCFGPQAAMIGMVTGGDSIPVARLSMDWHQVSGSGAGQLDLEIVSPEIARIEGSVDFDYVAVYIPDALKKLAQQSTPYDAENLGFEEPAPRPCQRLACAARCARRISRSRIWASGDGWARSCRPTPPIRKWSRPVSSPPNPAHPCVRCRKGWRPR